jgi:hypothetical protein
VSGDAEVTIAKIDETINEIKRAATCGGKDLRDRPADP